MNSRRTLIALSAAVTLTLPAALWFSTRRPAASTSMQPIATPDARLERRMAGTESEVRVLRTLLSRATPEETALRAPEPSPLADPTPPDEKTTEGDREAPELSPEERDRQQLEQTIATLEDTFASEVRDVAWERDSQRAVAEALVKPELAGTRVGSVACAQTLCKIVIEHHDQAAWQKFNDADALLRAPFTGGSGFSHYSKETHETLVFLTRRGEHLPKIPG